MKRVQELVQANPASPDGHVALAEASLAAQLWGQARTHLQKALEQRPTRAVFQLLARVEREERKDEAAANVWLMRAGTDSIPEPSWTCGGCGHHTPDFAVCCPACGAPGRLEWT
ncbi:tetratricopeptide repeat protein [Magnetospirillum sp. 15-1]|uniref:tetratricopeptide repeat protein n=1 Tax=Magnetospirillum sp. 15-1 TaxID=1979370 RepID=UPI001F5B938E|nr:tetratricopeptide repeat protein [Magnetospirillum sp. 15-1]